MNGCGAYSVESAPMFPWPVFWGVNVRESLIVGDYCSVRTSTAVRHNRFVFAHGAVLVRVSSGFYSSGVVY